MPSYWVCGAHVSEQLQRKCGRPVRSTEEWGSNLKSRETRWTFITRRSRQGVRGCVWNWISGECDPRIPHTASSRCREMHALLNETKKVDGRGGV